METQTPRAAGFEITKGRSQAEDPRDTKAPRAEARTRCRLGGRRNRMVGVGRRRRAARMKGMRVHMYVYIVIGAQMVDVQT